MRNRIEDFVNQHYHFLTIEDFEDYVCEEFEDVINGIYTDENGDNYVMSFGVENDEECLEVTLTIQTCDGGTDFFGKPYNILEIVDFSII